LQLLANQRFAATSLREVIPHGKHNNSHTSYGGSTMAKKKIVFDATTHSLVPEHVLLTDKEKKELFEKYSITVAELPKIFETDAAIVHLKVKPGDVVKIIKKSPTAGSALYYRGVISE
jgi:DNA-directed RNA polymerase subunit H